VTRQSVQQVEKFTPHFFDFLSRLWRSLADKTFPNSLRSRWRNRERHQPLQQ
jgi:hypothetical protein